MAREGKTSGDSGDGKRTPQRRPTARGTSAPGVSTPVIFRRRRAVVGALLVLILLGVIAGSIAVAFYLGSREGGNPVPAASGTAAGTSTAPQSPADALGSSSRSATGTATATDPSTATATATATPTAAACDANMVTVSAAVDATVYPAGQDPVLTLKVTNSSKVPCTVNVGTSQMEFLITSGNDRIFSSKDCQADATDLIKAIGPDASESANFPWSRIRSAAGCPAVGATPGGGGAYYMLTVSLGHWSSAKVSFQLQ